MNPYNINEPIVTPIGMILILAFFPLSILYMLLRSTRDHNEDELYDDENKNIRNDWDDWR